MRKCLSDHDDEMKAILEDYKSFCSDSELLPRDQFTMFVPPCSQSLESNRQFKLYYCPSDWSRRRAKYLGVYAKKAVRMIGIISNVVTCDLNKATNELDIYEQRQSTTNDERKRIMGAINAGAYHGWNVGEGHKFYLCDKILETEFIKTSSYGIQGHRYFDLGLFLKSDDMVDLGAIANRLRDITWEEAIKRAEEQNSY